MAQRTPHILIVGAGLGGLLLGQTLRKNNIHFEIFERDRSDNIRAQGWAMGLHTILDEPDASIPDDMPSRDFVNHLLPLKYNYEWAWYRHDRTKKLGIRDDGSGNFLRANRARLRKWLATNMPIQYGKHAIRIEEHDDLVTVHFEDGTSATGDILIGAEGSCSPSKKYLLGGEDVIRHPHQGMINGEVILSGHDMEQQLQMGVSCYLVDASLTDETPSFFFVGLSEVFPDGKSGRYYFNIFWRDENATKKDFWTYSASSEKLYETALEKTKHLPPKFRSIGRITLLGDSAHSMPTFRGEGGFHALLDALKLGKVLSNLQTNNTDDIRRALGDYQDEMLERGSKAAEWSNCAYDKAWSGDDAGPRIIWGMPVVPLPDEKITL
ncbi:putative monooxygenase [Daldinia eschscholtzii]|nr:putative monooxygenase [Daldinia eschscholtzii]